MIYRDLLFDLDHTLLDFNAAEDVALTELLTEAHVDDVETYKEVYIPMNRKLWNDLSLKKITKKELVDTRFSRLFAHFGHEVDGHAFAMRYQDFLSQQGQTLPGADQLLDQLNQEGYRILVQQMALPRFKLVAWLIQGLKIILNTSLSLTKLVIKSQIKAFMTPFLEPFHDLIRKKL